MKQSSAMTGLLLATVLLFIICGVAKAQQTEPGSASIVLGDGYLFINNGKDKSFTFEVRSKKIEPVSSGSNPTFKVDGKIVQIVILPNENFLGKTKETGEEKLLELHQTWESAYLENDVYHAKLRLESQPISLKDRKMLFWGFTRPGLSDVFDRDYFLTTVVGNRLLGLSSPINIGESVSDYKKLFIEILSTLKISNKPFDVAKLSEEIRKGTYKAN